MNIQNLRALNALLGQAGFQNLSYPMLQYICCQPAHFTLSQELSSGGDLLQFQIYFERKGSEYQVAYYDASLFRQMAVPALTINQVGLQELEGAMKEIDWRMGAVGAAAVGVAADVAAVAATFRIDDESTWIREKKIERVVLDLARLSAVAEGKVYADLLKVRFWVGTILERLNGSLAAIRSKTEVVQRFYVIDGEVIPINEACRFLQNRWMEKAVLAKKKADAHTDETRQPAGNTKRGNIIKKNRVGKGFRSAQTD